MNIDDIHEKSVRRILLALEREEYENHIIQNRVLWEFML